MFDYLRKQFTGRVTDKDGSRVRSVTFGAKSGSATFDPTSGKLHSFRTEAQAEGPLWLGDDERSALIDPRSRRLMAYIWHDGRGKYYPTIFVSYSRAWKLISLHEEELVSLLPFPRCAIDLCHYACMEDAQEVVEAALKDAALGVRELAE
jgi:hypothetical protein